MCLRLYSIAQYQVNLVEWNDKDRPDGDQSISGLRCVGSRGTLDPSGTSS